MKYYFSLLILISGLQAQAAISLKHCNLFETSASSSRLENTNSLGELKSWVLCPKTKLNSVYLREIKTTDHLKWSKSFIQKQFPHAKHISVIEKKQIQSFERLTVSADMSGSAFNYVFFFKNQKNGKESSYVSVLNNQIVKPEIKDITDLVLNYNSVKNPFETRNKL